VSVCLSVTVVSPAKTAERIKMPFGLRTTWVGPRNHVLDGSGSPRKGAFLRGEGWPILKNRDALPCVSCAKTGGRILTICASMTRFPEGCHFPECLDNAAHLLGQITPQPPF